VNPVEGDDPGPLPEGEGGQGGRGDHGSVFNGDFRGVLESNNRWNGQQLTYQHGAFPHNLVQDYQDGVGTTNINVNDQVYNANGGYNSNMVVTFEAQGTNANNIRGDTKMALSGAFTGRCCYCGWAIIHKVRQEDVPYKYLEPANTRGGNRTNYCHYSCYFAGVSETTRSALLVTLLNLY
jgi:hypothetical protein